MRACTSVSGGSTPVDTRSVSGWSPGTGSGSMFILWLARAARPPPMAGPGRTDRIGSADPQTNPRRQYEPQKEDEFAWYQLWRSRSWPFFDPVREQVYYLSDARRAQVIGKLHVQATATGG